MKSFSPWALAAVLSIAAPLYAQAPGAHEITASGGYNHITADDAATRSSAWGGASYARGAGRGDIKVDYEYFRRNFTNEREQFNLIGAGWLFQWDLGPRQVKPFLQVGWIFGIHISSLDGRTWLMGPAVAGGLTVNLSKRAFIRPELRCKILSPGPIFPLQPGVTVGWRF